jgi:hypothetical protein
MSIIFTIHSIYPEINGDYFEYENVHYSGGNIKKSYRNKNSSLFIFYNEFHCAWWAHDDYNTTLHTKNINEYDGLGILHAISYANDDLIGQWHFSNDNFLNKTGPIPNLNNDIPQGYILYKNNEYTILVDEDNGSSYTIQHETTSDTMSSMTMFNSNNTSTMFNSISTVETPTKSLTFTIDSNNLPIIKLQQSEKMVLTDDGILFKNNSVNFSTYNSIINQQDNGLYISNTNNKIIFGVSGEDIMYITNDGKLGIGTADPSYNIHVHVPVNRSDEGGLRCSFSNHHGFWWRRYSANYTTADNGTSNGMGIFSGGSNTYWRVNGTTRMIMKHYSASNDFHPSPKYETTMLGLGTETARAPLDLATYYVGKGTSTENEYIQNNKWHWMPGAVTENRTDGGAGDGGWIVGYNQNNEQHSVSISGHTSMVSEGTVYASMFAAYSDIRTKTNIIEMDDAISLNKIRALHPRSFEYIDKKQNGFNKINGFIAQEVLDVIPEAITYVQKYIPNIYKFGNCKLDSAGNQLLYISRFDMDKLEYDSSGNIYPCIQLYDDKDKVFNAKIEDILFSRCFQISSDEKIPETVFVYGQKVENFLNINYTAIYTVSTSALKEVDRHLSNHEDYLTNMENQLMEIDNIISNLESTTV